MLARQPEIWSSGVLVFLHANMAELAPTSRKLGGKHGKRESKKEARKATGSGPDRPLAGTGLEDEVIFEYDVEEYDFRTAIHDMLQIERYREEGETRERQTNRLGRREGRFASRQTGGRIRRHMGRQSH